ncbi:MAG TPA: DUF885 domain-containing protein [Bryobacteraceae bacterium]|jgi:uncharacterized protein (DUF885 family)|nr:DUF885 domain-containing protein [Bryobacteraceae bacterium]
MLTRRTACLALVAAGAASKSTFAQPPRTIDDFFREFTDEWIRINPNLATSLRYFTGAEQDVLERQLTPLTIASARQRLQLARKGLAELRKFDRAGMTDTQRISAEVMAWQLEMVAAEEPYWDYSFPLEQMNGWNVASVERFTVARPLAKPRDAENYVAALAQVSTRMEEAIAESRRLAAKNVIPPRFILEATIKQIQSFVDPSPGQNPFVTAFADKMAAAPAIPAAQREQLRAEAERVVGTQIYPAWKKAAATLQAQLPRSTNDAGLWRLKGGPEAYAFFLKRYTTTSLTAEQIHEIGLEQVARIEAQMDGLLRQLGRTAGPVKERIAKLKLDLQYPNPTSDESRAQIMRDIDAIIRDAEKRAALLFDLRPKAPVVAQPFPRFREANAAANYNAPAPDGSRPGTFQFPRRIEWMTRFGLRSVVYHETVPGHHFHIALQVENHDLPRFMQVRALGGISAITEGWGLYAERLAAESGWYGDDIEGRLGQLDYELMRARRLVIDTGLHAKRWTRQQAIDYGIEASEVERYTVFPGQACSYMIGELRILELRDKAQKALGDRFALREFHNVVLRAGSVPLQVLENQVNAYVAAKNNVPAVRL